MHKRNRTPQDKINEALDIKSNIYIPTHGCNRMSELSELVTRKFTHSYAIGDWDIETDTGWQPITHIHQTVPYEQWSLRTANGKTLDCADTHIVFDADGRQVYARDLVSGRSYIQTRDGCELVVSVIRNGIDVPMYDLTVDSPDHRFYTNGILSHNTTVLDAICFALYGKPFRAINKPTIINSVNEKNLVVEIQFETQNNHYLVRRGIKPNVFDIICNGTAIPEFPSLGEMQDYLERYVLKCNYKAFCQVVILGASSYVPFMRLTPQARREILEDVLDIEVFSAMQSLVKDKLSQTKENIGTAQHAVQVIESQLTLVKNYEEQWAQQQQEKRTLIESQIAKNDATDRQLHEERNAPIENEAKMREMVEKMSEWQEKHTKATKLVARFATERQHLSHSHTFFKDHDQCPMCTQTIDEDFKSSKLADNEAALAKIDTDYQEAQQIANKLAKRLESAREAQKQLQAVEVKRKQIEERIKSLVNDTKRLVLERDRTFDAPPPPPTEIGDLDAAQEAVNTLVYQKQVQEHANALLKDTGIRTRIIQQYLPIINRNINQYLSALNFPIQFTLNEQFEETIKSRHRDVFSYENFSEGEKRRIDLALVLTWRAIARMKNSVYTNLLMMDEIFDSSLDLAGTEDFLALLHTLGSDTNVFIISHKTDQMIDKFPAVISVSKEKGFSVVKPL